MCGENALVHVPAACTEGSSPRVRGKLSVRVMAGSKIGLIPACAGKTEHLSGGCAWTWAHPRVCGENQPLALYGAGSEGSSPRVRGKLSPRFLEQKWGGLIPACAGKTTALRRRSALSRAHPRVCGENYWPWVWIASCGGSSPRVRGKHGTRCFGSPIWGLIPACAGKTGYRLGQGSSTRAHPRVCGENYFP